jgi:pSer/pThr/pTyr-binding forkhead associated (FHA) protein
MATTIRLTVLTGPHRGIRFCTRGPNACLVGRSANCHVRFCGEPADLEISRVHCKIILDPPHVRIQDMGSLNGTLLNGQKVGGIQEADASPGVAQDGDIITVGGTSMRVNVLDCPESFAESCDAAVAGDQAEIVKKDCPIEC